MRDVVHRDDKNIVQQLNEYGMPVFEGPEAKQNSRQEAQLEKAYWTGIRKAAQLLISHGATSERATQLLTQADAQILQLKKELEDDTGRPREV